MATKPIIWRGSLALQEQPDSPKWTFGEQVTLELRYRGRYDICLASAPGYGAIGTGQAAGLRVRESTVTRERGSIGLLTIVMAPFGSPPPGDVAPLPPDTEQLVRDQVEYALNYHPMFATVTSQQLTDINFVLESKWDEPGHQDALDRINTNFAAGKLLLKRQRGQSHYVLFPPSYLRTSYSWEEPTNLSAGGFIETPQTVNISLPLGVKWLRLGDALSHNGTHYELSRKWLASPDVDEEIYTRS